MSARWNARLAVFVLLILAAIFAALRVSHPFDPATKFRFGPDGWFSVLGIACAMTAAVFAIWTSLPAKAGKPKLK
jgi:hypothetical protein